MNEHTIGRLGPAQYAQQAAQPARTPNITVAVLDREPVSRAGLCGVLRRAAGLEIAGEAADYAAAAQLVRQAAPAVLIARLRADDGHIMPFLAWARRQPGGTQIIVLSSDAVSEELLFDVLRTGVGGLLDGSEDAARLVEVVRTVAAGGAVLTPVAAETLLHRFAGVDVERAEHAAELIRTLTDRERDVLALIAEGVDNAEIGRRLYVSVSAVKANVTRLLTKLKCENRVQAACLFQAAGLLGPAQSR
jgi:DNA-binding NarL/FixJ family response regulator